MADSVVYRNASWEEDAPLNRLLDILVLGLMASNMQSLSRDNADSKPSFRSPKHGRSPSPFFSREDPSKISDNRRRSKDTGRDLDRDSARNRNSRSSDSNRHSDRQSYRSSYDYHRHDNYSRHQKHADEGERNYHRLSSRSG
ncbi:hypothetical protein HHK36_017146 [Tetracentron sinense]|uniref:Uncharacterized protein n=1 Tax=Tetracentron sinense TaxID=13715 RepID=A0A834Z2M5_TETSI|nr:hypothetical protein HHK36_017146 [Tetracentron sinense]